MAGRAVALMNSCCGKEYPAKLTIYVFFTCLVASTGGLVSGYEMAIFNKVSATDSFLLNFFPSAYWRLRENGGGKNEYCKATDGLLTLFTSSVYLVAMVSSLFAATVTRTFGRKWSMFIGGITFIVGSVLNSAAKSLLMLIPGRIFTGIGLGFANQSIPLYMSEMAPARVRGMLNLGFQMMFATGILVANIISYLMDKIEGGWGWRLSLLLAVVPGAILATGALALPDTPNSLIDRGHEEAAKLLLQRMRGTDEIEEEFQDLVVAGSVSRAVKHQWKSLMQERYRPPLTMAILIPLFQVTCGSYVIFFYATVLFRAVGFGDQAALMSAVITGSVNLVATGASIFSVDTVGRRALFIEGGFQMLICQIMVGALIGFKYGISGAEAELSKDYAALVLIFICLYVSAFAWSWGPLGVLVPSEIFPLEVRSAGQSVTVFVSMAITFVSSQVFHNMLCNLKFGFFFFYAGWVVIMTTFIVRFLPETKNVPIERMAIVWKKHSHWKKFFSDDALPADKWAAAA